MIFEIIKRAAATMVSAAILTASIPVIAAQDYLVDIGFDGIITNDQSEYVSVDGSSSGRVVEDGVKNKSYTVECGNVDNTLKVFLPEFDTGSKYVIQFDIRIEGAPAEGKITITNPEGSTYDVLTIDSDGNLRSKDNMLIGGINSTMMNTVSIMLDNGLKTNSIGFNGKINYYRQNMDVTLPGVSEITISTYATMGDTNLYLDNIRVYSGDKYTDKKTSVKYNEESIDYIAVDESGLSNKIYYKNQLDSSSSMSMTKLAKRNTIEWDRGRRGRIYTVYKVNLR